MHRYTLLITSFLPIFLILTQSDTAEAQNSRRRLLREEIEHSNNAFVEKPLNHPSGLFSIMKNKVYKIPNIISSHKKIPSYSWSFEELGIRNVRNDDPVESRAVILEEINPIAVNGGSWIFCEQTRVFRFNIEDSTDCGGTNGNVQFGSVTATIVTNGYNYNVIPNITGVTSQEYTGSGTKSESMSVTISKQVELVRATPPNLGLNCTTGDVNVTYYANIPYWLSPGKHSLEITFSTADEFYHKDSYYELDFTFETTF